MWIHTLNPTRPEARTPLSSWTPENLKLPEAPSFVQESSILICFIDYELINIYIYIYMYMFIKQSF